MTTNANETRSEGQSRFLEAAFGWWTRASQRSRKAFVAASLGWMLDAFDVMLYALVVAALIRDPDLHLTLSQAGLLSTLTLLAAAFGGFIFGLVSDRYGRKKALMWSVLLYAFFTFLCGFAVDVLQLALFRIGVGIGMGGEWGSGAALVAESFPSKDRGKALAFVQSMYAVGYGLAALTNMMVMPHWGWRGVFFVGIVPAIFALWVRLGLEESPAWQSRAQRERPGASGAHSLRVSDLFRGRYAKVTFLLTLMNALCLFAWWGMNSWVPAYLRLPPAQGGVGLTEATMSLFVIAMQVGMWLGYVSFAYVAEAIGRRGAYVTFLVTAGVLLPVYGMTSNPGVLLVLGPLLAFFGTGFFSGFGPLASEMYPTAVRGTAMGFTYNGGRVVSAAAPLVVGALAAATGGFQIPFVVTAAAFLLAAFVWIGIPNQGAGDLD